MKKTIAFSLQFFITIVLFCQIQTEVIQEDKTKLIELKNPKPVAELASSFKNVNIVDNRDDTSSLGYYYFNKNTTKKYILEKSTSEALHHWFSSYLNINQNNNSGFDLFICIKKLRIASELSATDLDRDQRFQNQNELDKGVFIKMDFYLQKDSLYSPLYRFDSLMIFEENENPDECLFRSLETCMSKLLTLNIGTFNSKRKLSIIDIYSYNRIKTPILSVATFQKGVYRTFAEFKNNAPGLPSYEFSTASLSDMLYINENGSQYLARNAWGFCDGKEFYINSGDKYSKLIRIGNTFYFEGIKNLTKKLKEDLGTASLFNMATNTNRLKTKYKAVLKYYQLDMETGNIY